VPGTQPNFLQRNATLFGLALAVAVNFGTVIWFAAMLSAAEASNADRLSRVEGQGAVINQQATAIAVSQSQYAELVRRLGAIEDKLDRALPPQLPRAGNLTGPP
jgi:hypothetical protein